MSTCRRICRLTVWLVILALLMSTEASAVTMPYEGYIYNYWGDSVPSLAGYGVGAVLDSSDIPPVDLSHCVDLFVYQDELYILDSSAKTIYVLNTDYQVLRSIRDFHTEDGNPFELVSPNGIYIRDDTLYIADQGGFALRCTMDGTVLFQYTRPDSYLLQDLTDFKPSKVIADAAGNCYLLCTGLFDGLINYNRQGKFLGFYGANEVQLTAGEFMAKIWKTILTREQAQSMIRFVPVEYANMYIVGDFIYTVTKTNSNSVDEIRKLNAMGGNVLHYDPNAAQYSLNNFGDVETATYRQTVYDSQLVDIHVDEDGLITVLDFERGRLFQYDQHCQIVAIFGGSGDKKGNFLNPVALEKFNGSYVVLDAQKGSLTVFKETTYMSLIRKGIRYYQNGSQEMSQDEALDLWYEVLSYNDMYRLALLNIGRILSAKGDYKQAMDYFRRAESRSEYSQAFRYYRSNYLRNNFYWILLATIAILTALIWFIRFAKRKLGFGTKKVRIVYK